LTDAETYTNPQTRIPTNVGVAIFENTTVVSNYFSRLNVSSFLFNPVTDVPQGTPATLNYDFSLGFPIPAQDASAVAAQQQAVASAAQNYTINVLSKYPWIDLGFLVPDPVPEELLVPFSQLAQTYGFLPLLPIIAQYNWFTGDIATIPALYGIKGLGPALLSSIFGKFIVSASGDTRSLYEAAARDLGDSIMLNTTVVKVRREVKFDNVTTGVTVLVHQPGKPHKLICARKLLVAIPQTLKNVDKYDLSDDERNIFSKFSALGYWAGVVTVPGLNNSIRNVGAQTPFNQPVIPGTSAINAAGSPGDFVVAVGFNDLNYTEATGQNVVRDSLAKLSAVGAVPQNAAQVATFPFSSDHGDFNLRVSADEIKKGFYSKLLSAQGARNTYWTGAAFTGQNSGSVWNFNEGTVVPGLKKDLGL
jgi:hypothetical protein